MARKTNPGKHTGFLTPAAQTRKEMQEAKNLDERGTRKLPGDTCLDRDGYEWRIQAAVKGKDGNGTYLVTPIPRPRFGDMGYVFRRVSDATIDARDFGFKAGTNLRMVDGELVSTPTQFS